MKAALAILLLAVGWSQACVVYEYEHEFWLRVDGSGRVNVTGRPALWTAFKALDGPVDADALKASARALFERSGLRVRRVTVTERDGRPYLFVAAEFDDVNRLSGTPAFPDLQIRLRRADGRLELEGEWRPPESRPPPAASERDGLLAVRFHVPSKVYSHRNAFAGVERGNILSWREDVAAADAARPLTFGASLDERSILGSTVALFAAAIAAALALMGVALWLTVRRGRKAG